MYKALTIAGVLLASPVAAQNSQCGPRETVLNFLMEEFGETHQAIGITSSGGFLEILAAPTGSFTIVFTAPNGISCLVVSGEAFELVVAARKPAGAPL